MMKMIWILFFVMGFGTAAHAEWTTITLKRCGWGVDPAVECYGPLLRRTGEIRVGFPYKNTDGSNSDYRYQTNADIGSSWTCDSSSWGFLGPTMFENSNPIKSVRFNLPAGGITVLQYSGSAIGDWIIALPGPNRTCEEAIQLQGIDKWGNKINR